MSAINETVITKDQGKRQLTVVRQFEAPVDQVFKAWTDSSLLDQWWAPKPWKARTKKMEFRPGGSWLYARVSPEGEEHWAFMDFESTDPQKSYTAVDGFCDENGARNNDLPGMKWNTQFEPEGPSTKVTVYITFTNEAQMEQIIAMGFKEGFTMAHGNLDELLQKQTTK